MPDPAAQPPASPARDALPVAPAPGDLLRVTSETAPLRQVVVHAPGEEMVLVSPENKDELLFDDILFAEVAREEHAVMCALFERIVGRDDAVLRLADLALEAFQAEDARHDYVASLARALPERNLDAYARELQALAPEELHRFAFTGQAGPHVRSHPLPNLLFTRDLSAVVGDHVILSHAATHARLPESVLISTVLRHHPRFAAHRDRLITLPPDVSFEGGDLLVVNAETVMIGHSERTSFGGVMAVAEALLSRTAVRHVLMVNLPKQRSCMHLDTVFTFADDETCVVFPPIIEQDRGNVFHFERDAAADGPGRFRTRVLPSVKAALEEMTERPLTFIPCGGEHLINQRREQWTDGANLFAIAPGLVVGYERNRCTFDAMRAHGFHVVDAESFLDFYGEGEVPPRARVAIRLTGNELSRGRGGPRCMTMPLARA